MDNDLLSLWLNAAFLNESQVRDIIQELQDTRNTADEADAQLIADNRNEARRLRRMCAVLNGVADRLETEE